MDKMTNQVIYWIIGMFQRYHGISFPLVSLSITLELNQLHSIIGGLLESSPIVVSRSSRFVSLSGCFAPLELSSGLSLLSLVFNPLLY